MNKKHIYKLLLFIFISNYSSNNPTDLIREYDNPSMQIAANRLSAICRIKNDYDRTPVYDLENRPDSFGSALLCQQQKLYDIIIEIANIADIWDIELINIARRMVKYSEGIRIPTNDIKRFEAKKVVLNGANAALSMAIGRIVER